MQPELFEPEHRSNHLKRLAFSAHERAYLGQWQKLNERHSYLNGGWTTLEALMTPEGKADLFVAAPVITQRDAVVAASFAQWLGTNCGRAYIGASEKEAAGDQRFLDNLYWRRHGDPHPAFEEQARIIAAGMKGHAGHAELIKNISAALQQVRSAPRTFDTSYEREPRGILLHD